MAEIFWYITASLLAGVGTGLVGLSAATVMVPILIVLCPSFARETGAYHPEWQRHSNRPRGRCHGAPGSRSFDRKLTRQLVSFCLS